jgi:hypothetical protein
MEPCTDSDGGALNPRAIIVSPFSALYSSLWKVYFGIQMIFFMICV